MASLMSSKGNFLIPLALKSSYQLLSDPPSSEPTERGIIKGLNIPDVDALCYSDIVFYM